MKILNFILAAVRTWNLTILDLSVDFHSHVAMLCLRTVLYYCRPGHLIASGSWNEVHYFALRYAIVYRLHLLPVLIHFSHVMWRVLIQVCNPLDLAIAHISVRLCLTQVDKWRHSVSDVVEYVATEKVTRIYFQHTSCVHTPVGNSNTLG
jgi:hypothetical protein